MDDAQNDEYLDGNLDGNVAVGSRYRDDRDRGERRRDPFDREVGVVKRREIEARSDAP